MDSSTFLIVALVAIAIGFVVGFLVHSLTSGKDNNEAAQDQLPAPSQPISDKKRVDVAALWREPPMGALRVDMGGKTYVAARDLPDDQHRRLRVTLADLEMWLTAAEPAPQIPVAPPAANLIGNLPEPPAPSLLAPLSTPLMQSARQAAAVSTGSLSTPAAPKSIASQINDILQEQIAGTPLETRHLRLTESPMHGVVVLVGASQYAGIDAVPDLEIRAAIQHAAQTWEKRGQI